MEAREPVCWLWRVEEEEDEEEGGTDSKDVEEETPYIGEKAGSFIIRS